MYKQYQPGCFSSVAWSQGYSEYVIQVIDSGGGGLETVINYVTQPVFACILNINCIALSSLAILYNYNDC